MHVAQTMEYNLCKLVCLNNLINNVKKGLNKSIKEALADIEVLYDEFIHKPLGYAVEEAKNTLMFDDDFIKKLSKALHRRNYYAHRFFKEDFKNNNIINNPESFIPDLDYNIKLLTEINNLLADKNKLLLDKIKSNNI